uniref:Uncharacterized protein n=1 Tax=Setaria italica TaxID=4555 RepID=K4A1N2_SETIT
MIVFSISYVLAVRCARTSNAADEHEPLVPSAQPEQV